MDLNQEKLARFEVLKQEGLFAKELLQTVKRFERKHNKTPQKFIRRSTEQIVASWSPKRLQNKLKKTEMAFPNSENKTA